MSETTQTEMASDLGRFRSYPDYRNSCVEWLGEIPPHWEMRRLKYIASLNDETLSEDADPNLEIRYVDIGSVQPIDGIVEAEQLTFDKAPSRARRIVRDGDVIVSTVRTYLRAVAAITDPEPNLVASTGFAVVRPRSDFWSSFAAYVLKAPYFVDTVVANSVGVSYPAINPSQMACLPIAVPPLHEQRAIAEFLDRETAKIDALVAKKERLIELLQEKRTALITYTVTQGLDPNVPMKEPGVEWLGEIPTHWEVKALKRLAAMRAGIAITSNEIEPTGQYPVFGGNGIRGYTSSFTHEGEFPLIGRQGALCGCVNFASGRFWASEHAVVATPGLDVDAHWLTQLLQAMSLNLYSQSAAQPGLAVESIGAIQAPAPSIEDQRAITAFLDSGTAKIDALVARVRDAIDRLKEFRTALISAAVTGKIDVREEGLAIQREKRDVFAAEIVHRLHKRPTFGHVAAQKHFYLAEAHLGVDQFEGEYYREAAGPYDRELLRSIDDALRKRGWYEAVQTNGDRWEYRPLDHAGGHRSLFDRYWASKVVALDRLMSLVGDFDTRSLQIVATLYAAWNDFLIDGRSVTDDQIVNEVLLNWHHEKEDIREEEWRRFLEFMKRNDLVPTGQGPETRLGRLL